MNSYDTRSPAQIRLDEMIWKYKTRRKEIEWSSKKFKPDEEILKQIDLLLSDLNNLKVLMDNNIGGAKNGKHN